jgi:peptidoglycan/xylan/chitin deacetylase (PgdA/CDA1 family)
MEKVTPKLKVILMVDTEADFYYKVPSPHFSKLDIIKWKINRTLGRLFKYPSPSRLGIINILKSLKKNNFPATFCVCGHLFLKSCRGYSDHKKIFPKNYWFHNKIGKNWYYWDDGGDYNTSQGMYLGDIIEREKNNPLFTFGLHAFSHEALTLEPSESVERIIKEGLYSAKKIGITPKSFASPFELTEEESDPEKIFDILRKNKIKRVFYSGTDAGLTKKRYFAVKKPLLDRGLEKIWISNYFEGNFNKKRMMGIIRDIEKNKDRVAVYCLVTHDFTHKSSKNVDLIVKFLKSRGFISYI